MIGITWFHDTTIAFPQHAVSVFSVSVNQQYHDHSVLELYRPCVTILALACENDRKDNCGYHLKNLMTLTNDWVITVSPGIILF